MILSGTEGTVTVDDVTLSERVRLADEELVYEHDIESLSSIVAYL